MFFGIPFIQLIPLVLFFLCENSFWNYHFILLQERGKIQFVCTKEAAVMHRVSEYSILLTKHCYVNVFILSHGDITASYHFLKSCGRWRCSGLCPALAFHERRRFLAGPAVLLFSYQVLTALRKTEEPLCGRGSPLAPKLRESESWELLLRIPVGYFLTWLYLTVFASSSCAYIFVYQQGNGSEEE